MGLTKDQLRSKVQSNRFADLQEVLKDVLDRLDTLEANVATRAKPKSG